MKLYSTKDAAKEAGVSPTTLRTYVRYGEITPEKLGGIYVFTEEHIEEIRRVLKKNRSRRRGGLNNYQGVGETPLIEGSGGCRGAVATVKGYELGTNGVGGDRRKG